VLKCLFSLRNEVQDFIESKEKFMLFKIHIGCSDSGFLLDITGYLNELNSHIQDNDQLFYTVQNFIRCFEIKLFFQEHKLKASNYFDFTT
jgi:hypothetical protein